MPLTTFAHTNRHLYSYVPSMTFESWPDAHAAAQALRCCSTNGHLVVVSDASERSFVRAHVAPTSSTGWTGLVDEANDRVWTDGPPPPSRSVSVSFPRSDIDSTIDCGSDPNYDDKDYLSGVRCREAAPMPIIVEFDCSQRHP